MPAQQGTTQGTPTRNVACVRDAACPGRRSTRTEATLTEVPERKEAAREPAFPAA